MKPRLFILFVLLLCSLFTLRAWGGERIVRDFQPGLPQGGEVLKQVPVKGLVAEFIDPQTTGLGKSLGYLLWREALTAVHDQRGAGIIYAHTTGDEPLTHLLRQDYHLAALEIAQEQKTRMVLWGAVGEEGGMVYIDSYLTLLPALIGESLSLTLKVNGKPLPGLATEIGSSRYSFAPIKRTRQQLFQRALVTRARTRLRQRPATDAPIIKRVSANTPLQAIDMRGSWFEIALTNETSAWVEIGQVDLPPRQVHAQRSRINIRLGPGKDTPALRKVDLNGDYRVLDRRHVPGKGVWYRLQFEWGSGWVAAWLVQPRFTLPAIQFMAGLQRYQLRNYQEAGNAFQRFIGEAVDRESNVNLAAAHALLGASLLMEDARSRAAYKAIEQAVNLTPYDPVVYNLNAVASLATQRPADQMVEIIHHALQLDPRNRRTLNLLDSLSNLAEMKRPEYQPLLHSFRLGSEGRVRLEKLRQTYLKSNP